MGRATLGDRYEIERCVRGRGGCCKSEGVLEEVLAQQKNSGTRDWLSLITKIKS